MDRENNDKDIENIENPQEDAAFDLSFFKEDEWLKTCIEGILFISEGQVKVRDINKVLKVPEKRIREMLDILEKEYTSENRGFILKKIGGGFRLYSNPALRDILKEFIKTNIRTHMSQAALETLAIIAYRQPVTRTQIAEIRGVRTDSVVLTLLDKELVTETGKLKEPGNPNIYRTTDRFLELLGLDNLRGLPRLTDFEDDEKNNNAEPH